MQSSSDRLPFLHFPLTLRTDLSLPRSWHFAASAAKGRLVVGAVSYSSSHCTSVATFFYCFFFDRMTSRYVYLLPPIFSSHNVKTRNSVQTTLINCIVLSELQGGKTGESTSRCSVCGLLYGRTLAVGIDQVALSQRQLKKKKRMQYFAAMCNLL